MTGERRAAGPFDGRYEALFDSIDEGIVVHDRHNRVVLANPAAAEILGVTPEDLLGTDSFDHRWEVRRPDGTPVLPEEHPVVVARRTGRAVTNAVLQLRRGDGAEVWVSVSSRPVFEAGPGEATGAVAWFRDVTEQRRTETALAESDVRFRLLFDHTRDAVYFFDVETLGFVECNEATLGMYGYTREQFLARDVPDVSAEPGATRDLIGRSYAGGTFTIPLRWHQRADGTVFPVSISAGAFEQGGRLIGYGLVRDVSDTFETETALRRERDHSRALLGALRDGLMETDPTGVITQVNDELCSMTGFGRDELIGRAMPHPFWPRVERELAASLAEEQLGNRDVELSRADGTTFHASVVWSSVRDAGGNRVGFLAVFRDLTERRRVERALAHRRARAAPPRRGARAAPPRDRSSRSRSDSRASAGLTSGIAHDFNNLLGVVVELRDVRRPGGRPRQPGRRRRRRDPAVGRSRRPRSTRELLLFSQGQVGAVEPFDLGAARRRRRHPAAPALRSRHHAGGHARATSPPAWSASAGRSSSSS